METTVQESTTVDYSLLPELKAGKEMERLTRKEFFALHGIVSLNKKFNQSSTENGNGVMFISAFTADNKCHNLYFSKNAQLEAEAEAIASDWDFIKGADMPATFFQKFRLMWSETPSLDKKDEAGNVVAKGYSWKVVSAKEGGNRVNADYFVD